MCLDGYGEVQTMDAEQGLEPTSLLLVSVFRKMA